ncbi:hypothetical protein [Methanobrevibacter sp. DSM 116169]|uniref:hypothetical protein n=1 Tax=Methanobrevibacter sp. DSM 116169 TaxID=3242727 RepID=UPI0038FC3B85
MKNESCCNIKETNINSCCGGNDFIVTDQSKIDNPKNPKKIIDLSFLKKLEDKAKDLGVIDIGYGKVPKNITINNSNLKFFNTIVLTMPIGMDIINAGFNAQKLNNKLYEKFGNATYDISDDLRDNGFETQVAHPKEDLLDLAILAEEAGIGYKGKSGLIINPNLGPRLKIAAILTSIENLPFNLDNNHKWIQEYCKKCSSCIKNCPKNALFENEDLTIADLNDSTCIGCTQGCTICIETCPFYLKGYSNMKNVYDKIKG